MGNKHNWLIVNMHHAMIACLQRGLYFNGHPFGVPRTLYGVTNTSCPAKDIVIPPPVSQEVLDGGE